MRTFLSTVAEIIGWMGLVWIGLLALLLLVPGIRDGLRHPEVLFGFAMWVLLPCFGIPLVLIGALSGRRRLWVGNTVIGFAYIAASIPLAATWGLPGTYNFWGFLPGIVCVLFGVIPWWLSRVRELINPARVVTLKGVAEIIGWVGLGWIGLMVVSLITRFKVGPWFALEFSWLGILGIPLVLLGGLSGRRRLWVGNIVIGFAYIAKVTPYLYLSAKLTRSWGSDWFSPTDFLTGITGIICVLAGLIPMLKRRARKSESKELTSPIQAAKENNPPA